MLLNCLRIVWTPYRYEHPDLLHCSVFPDFFLVNHSTKVFLALSRAPLYDSLAGPTTGFLPLSGKEFLLQHKDHVQALQQRGYSPPFCLLKECVKITTEINIKRTGNGKQLKCLSVSFQF